MVSAMFSKIRSSSIGNMDNIYSIRICRRARSVESKNILKIRAKNIVSEQLYNFFSDIITVMADHDAQTSEGNNSLAPGQRLCNGKHF